MSPTKPDEQAEIRALLIDPGQETPVVVLQTADRGMLVPIWIGLPEATAIAMALEKQKPPRPMTHDLTTDILRALGGQLVHVRVHTLEEGVFHAELGIQMPGRDGLHSVDCRPSDAIALAVRAQATILVSGQVVEAAGVEPMSEDDAMQEVLADLRPEDLGKYEM